MSQEAHDNIYKRARDRSRDEAHGDLNSRDILHILEEQSEEGLDGVEYASGHEDADADGRKDAIAPGRVGYDGWQAEPLLLPYPEDECRNQCNGH